MTRHGKNSTSNPVYSNEEKRKDAKTSKYGTIEERFGKDSLKPFHCCSLTLQPCKEPVITPDGYLYDKEAILECLLTQKMKASALTKEYEKQVAAEKKRSHKQVDHMAQVKAKRFMDDLVNPAGPPKRPRVPEDPHDHASGSNMSGDKKKSLPCFWIPELTPDPKQTSLEKPDLTARCPMSGKPLKIKDLTPVKFTPLPENGGSSKSGSSRMIGDQFMCPVSLDTIRDTTACVVLRPSGHVVTAEAMEKLIRPDMVCPITGVNLKELDIITLKSGGSSFAGSGASLTAKQERPVMLI